MPKTATRQQFLKAIAAVGATLDTEMEINGTLQIDTPKGKLFAANGCHTMVEEFSNHGGQSWKGEAYADVIEQLSLGLYDCEDPVCDICEEKSNG